MAEDQNIGPDEDGQEARVINRWIGRPERAIRNYNLQLQPVSVGASKMRMDFSSCPNVGELDRPMRRQANTVTDILVQCHSGAPQVPTESLDSDDEDEDSDDGVGASDDEEWDSNDEEELVSSPEPSIQVSGVLDGVRVQR